MISTSLGALRSAYSLPLLRVAPRGSASLVWQSKTTFFFDVHWLGRAFLCCGDGCQICTANAPRTRGYWVGVVDANQTRQPVLVESSPRELDRLIQMMALESDPLQAGHKVLATRKAANRPVRFTFDGPGGVVVPELTTDHRVLAAVAVLFGLPLPRRDESVIDFSQRIIPVVRSMGAVALRQAGGN